MFFYAGSVTTICHYLYFEMKFLPIKLPNNYLCFKISLLRQNTAAEFAISCLQSMDSMTVCAALQSQYMLVNTDTTHVQELFPYEASQTQPFTIRITKVWKILLL